MAHIEKSVEIDKPVGAVYQRWAELEEFPRFLEGLKDVGTADAHLRWRGEILTFAPKGSGTRVTLRIDYDAVGTGVGAVLQYVSRQLERDLELFRGFAEDVVTAAALWKLALTHRQSAPA